MDVDHILYLGRTVLNMTNEEVYESSLRFIFKQLNYYVKSNKIDTKQNKKSKQKSMTNNNKEVKVRKFVND